MDLQEITVDMENSVPVPDIEECAPEPIEKLKKAKYQPKVKVKRQATEAQLACLAKGRETRSAKAKQIAGEKATAKQKRDDQRLVADIKEENLRPLPPRAPHQVPRQLPPVDYPAPQQFPGQPMYMMFDPRMMGNQYPQAPPPSPVNVPEPEPVKQAIPRLRRV
jgi:hypothetical protein